MKFKGKVIPALILAAVLCFVGILILYSAKTSRTDVSIEYPKDYTVITEDNALSHEEYIEKLGFGTNSFVKYLQSKNIVSFAGNENNSRQFRLVVKATEFTEQLRSISGATDKELQVVAKELLPDGYSYIYRLGGNVYYEIDRLIEDKNGSHSAIQFITVKNGKYYALMYSGSGKTLSDEEREVVESTLKTMRIPDEGGVMNAASSGGIKRIVYIAIVSLVILAGVVFIILHGIAIIREIKNRRNQGEYSGLVIKRRKK